MLFVVATRLFNFLLAFFRSLQVFYDFQPGLWISIRIFGRRRTFVLAPGLRRKLHFRRLFSHSKWYGTRQTNDYRYMIEMRCGSLGITPEKTMPILSTYCSSIQRRTIPKTHIFTHCLLFSLSLFRHNSSLKNEHLLFEDPMLQPKYIFL